MATRTSAVVLRAEVNQFKADMRSAGQAAADAAKKTETSWDNSTSRLGKLAQASRQYDQQMTTAGTALAGFGAIVTGGLGLATKAAMSWESAWTGVLKTVNGSPRELEGIERGLRGLARQLPATHEEIAAVGEAAGQLGIETGSVVKFTKTMIDMGESTNLSADEAATSLARFMNIMQTDQKNVGKLGAAIVGLGNNFATTESEITEMAMRIAGAGKQANMSEGDVLGYAAALSSVGIEAEAGGTAISMVMKKMGNEVDGGGAKLDEFARIAGMSSSDFAAAWGDDSAGTMAKFITGLQAAKDRGENVNQVLSELGVTGIRESDALLRLSSASGVLTESLKMGNSEYEKGTALAEEAAKRYETAESKMRIAGNSMKDSAITIGGAFLPMFAQGMEAVASFAEAIGKLPEPVLQAGGVVAGIGGAVSLAAGGFLILTPRVVEAVEAFNVLRGSSATVGASLDGFVGKAGKATRALGLLTAAALAVQVTQSVVGGWLEGQLQPSDDAAASLERLAGQMTSTSVKKKDLDASFSDLGWIDGFGDAFNKIYDPNLGLVFDDMTSNMMFMESTTEQARARFAQLGEQMGTLAETDAAAAAASFQTMVGQTDGTSTSIQRLIELMPAYKDQLIQQAEAQQLGTDNATLAKIAMGELGTTSSDTAGAVTEVGAAAADTATSLADMLNGLVALGLATLSEREALRGYEESIDAVNESIKENGTTLDVTTAKGRANQAAFDGIADAGIRAAQSMAENGASQEDVRGQLQSTYDSLVDAAGQFGITGKKAEDMAREVLGIPDNANVDTWFDTEATKQAKDLEKAVKAIPGKKSVNVVFTVDDDQLQNMPENLLNPYRKMRKGPKDVIPKKGQGYGVLKRAGGGAITGPGSGTSDEVLMWGSNGEHVLTADEVAALGGQQEAYRLRAAIRSGSLPAFAGGGALGGSRQDSELREAQREAEARAKRIADLRAELRKDVRRGSVRDQVTGSLSGGYSAVDQLTSLSQNEDLSRGARAKAGASVSKFEADLRKLYSRAESLDEKLADAKTKAAELEGIQKSVSTGLLSKRDLDMGDYQNFSGGQWATYSGVSGATRRMTADVGKMKEFAGKLKKLAGMGLPGGILQEIAGAGVDEGSTIADAFLGASGAERSAYVGAWKDYEKYANAAGQYVTEGFYSGGVNAAQGVVKGLESQQKTVEAQIANLARSMEATLKSVLGIHSPSTVMAELGAFAGEGLIAGLLGSTGGVQEAAASLAAAVVPNVSVPAVGVTAEDSPDAQGTMVDMSAETVESMTIMKDAVVQSMLEQQTAVTTANLAMSTDTSLQQETMRANVALKQQQTLDNVTTQQEALRSTMAEKQESMRLATTDSFENMRATATSKMSSMRWGINDTMNAFKEDYDGHLTDLKDTTRSGFGSMESAGRKAFSGIRSGMNSNMRDARPELGGKLNSLINVFGKFTSSINTAFKDVGVKLSAPKPVAFASGGVLPGPRTPGKDIHHFQSQTGGDLFLGGREAIMRQEFTDSVGGERGVRQLNDMARQGRLSGLRTLLEQDSFVPSQAFASGGVFRSPAYMPGVNAFADSGVWRGLYGIVKKQFPSATLNSAYRGGSVTVSGNRSNHSGGYAADLGGPMRQIFDFLYNNYRNSSEIIYSPANNRQIKNGRHYTYGPSVRAIHWNHVHWANKSVPGGAGNDMAPGMFGDDPTMPISHPFLDKAGVSAGGNLEASYAQAAKKLSKDIIGKHASMIQGNAMLRSLGSGVMNQVGDGLVKKARDYGKTMAAGGADFSGVPNGPVQQMAQEMLKSMGWEDQWPDLKWLVNKESSWNPNAQNPTSTAYGLFQFLNGTWGPYGPKTSDPRKQMEYGLRYIKDRYGSVTKARAFHRANNWYENGTNSAVPGWAVVGERGPELIKLNGGEQIANSEKARAMATATAPMSIDYDRLARAVVGNLPPSLVVQNDNAGLIEDRIAQRTVQRFADHTTLFTAGV